MFRIKLILLLTLLAISHHCLADSSIEKVPKVCSTSQDCHISQEDDYVGEAQIMLFCHRPNQCLCNQISKQDNRSHTEAQCYMCNRHVPYETDACTMHDPFSLCNRQSGECQCNTDLISIADNKTTGRFTQTAYEQSVCMQIHRKELIDTKDTNKSIISPWLDLDNYSFDWILTAILAYVLPFTLIFCFLYYTYTHFCNHKVSPDSNVILYRQL